MSRNCWVPKQAHALQPCVQKETGWQCRLGGCDWLVPPLPPARLSLVPAFWPWGPHQAQPPNPSLSHPRKTMMKSSTFQLLRR